MGIHLFFFFSSRRRHTRCYRDWSSDVCSSDLLDSGWVHKDLGAEQEALAAALADLGIDPGAGEQRLTVWQIAGASPTTLRTLEQLGGDTETMATLDRLREQI